MSWLKLNDSLNKVKGSITSFTQEVFAEGIIGEDENEQNPVRELNIAREKITQLSDLCATQDQESIPFSSTVTSDGLCQPRTKRAAVSSTAQRVVVWHELTSNRQPHPSCSLHHGT
uniref:Uncharacterized protein n=1 Tax=Anopheles culicifacies TaxID=139723 RepID=A0A182MGE3_9DIPT